MRALAFVALVVLGACAPPLSSGGEGCDLAGFRRVQQAHAGRSEVTICGRVASVRAVHRTRSGAHRDFIVDVGSGDRIEVDSNVDIMGNFPIQTGQRALVRGEYYYDGGGRQGVHFTHHATGGRHPAGFVNLDGRVYR